jgi:hypothetical protein
MMGLTDKQSLAVETYTKCNNSETLAARELGVDVKALRSSLWLATKKGWQVEPDRYCDAAPVGFGLTNSTIHIKDGEVFQRWDRVSPIIPELTQEYFNQRIPAIPKVSTPTTGNDDLMVEWGIFDLHQGLYAWAEEAGADYDSDIARTLMTNAAREIFRDNVSEAVIIGGGDNLHADNRSNRTEKSGHILDVDSRYQKTVWIAYETWTTAIDIALHVARTVRVVIVSGNHDPMSAIHLAMVLAAHYRDEKRVVIDTSPQKHKFYRWGKNYFMVSHGDTGSKRLASYMMNHIIRNDITGIERMYVRAGHLHKKGRDTPPGLIEEDGVVVELFPTLAAKDAWSSEEAYSNQRATIATTWHKEWGMRSRIELGVRELMNV